VLWILGVFFKRTPKIPDWTIIWILAGLGIVAAVDLDMDIAITSPILQGILVTGVAVLGHQAFKQYTKKNDI